MVLEPAGSPRCVWCRDTGIIRVRVLDGVPWELPCSCGGLSLDDWAARHAVDHTHFSSETVVAFGRRGRRLPVVSTRLR